MGILASIRSLLVSTFIFHLVVGYTFITSGLIVCSLMLLAYILVWPFSKDLYRKIVVRLAYTHWCQFTFLGHWWSGSNCLAVFENPDDYKYIGKEHTIVIMNHKYDIDWLMGWILAERFGLLGGTKIYGKSSLRYIPLIGWAWTFTESIFLKREWDSDKKTLIRDLKYLTEYPNDYWVTVLLFPEGTRFTEAKHKESMEVAKKKGYPLLKHHLLPRTKGFITSIRGAKGKIPAILDVTVGFRSDGADPTLLNIVQGNACKAEMYVRRIPIDSIPTSTDEECAEYLQKHFREKDEIYDDFVQHGTFTKGTKMDIPRRWHDLVTVILWNLFLGLPFAKFVFSKLSTASIPYLIIMFSIFILIGIGVRKAIAVTETQRGSSYGVKQQKTE